MRRRKFTSDDIVPGVSEKKVIRAAREYVASAFPNPDRIGCPGRQRLEALALQTSAPDAGYLDHLMTCSACFIEYQAIWKARKQKRALIIGTLVAAGLVVFVTARFVYKHLGAAPPAISKTKVREGRDVAANQTVPTIAPSSLNIDLASFSPTRGDAPNDSPKKLRLPSKSLRVNFLLPLGMESGEYSLRLQDSAGTVFVDKRAPGRMKDGVTAVQVDIDLAGVHGGDFILMIRPPGLSWRRFAVLVE